MSQIMNINNVTEYKYIYIYIKKRPVASQSVRALSFGSVASGSSPGRVILTTHKSALVEKPLRSQQQGVTCINTYTNFFTFLRREFFTLSSKRDSYVVLQELKQKIGARQNGENTRFQQGHVQWC